MKSSDHHLSEEEIARGVIDLDTLSPEAKGHIDACSRCRSAIERTRQDLDRLGKLAAGHVPMPAGRILLPEEAGRHRHPFFARSAVFGAAAAVAAILLAFLWSVSLLPINPDRIFSPGPGKRHPASVSAPPAEEALPGVFTEMSGAVNEDEDEDDGFFDFVVPDMNGEPVAVRRDENGKEESLC